MLNWLIWMLCLPGAAVGAAIGMIAFLISYGAPWLVVDIWNMFLTGRLVWPESLGFWRVLGTFIVTLSIAGYANGTLTGQFIAWKLFSFQRESFMGPLYWWQALPKAIERFIVLVGQMAGVGLQLCFVKFMLLRYQYDAGAWAPYAAWMLYYLICSQMLLTPFRNPFLRISVFVKQHVDKQKRSAED